MNKHIQFFILIISLILPLNVWGQCASIYQDGESLMKNGRYYEAITKFKAAMDCDGKLESDCQAKIKECQRKINQAQQKKAEEELIQTYSLTVNTHRAEFEPNPVSPAIIEVESTPAEWKMEVDAEWCRIAPKENKILIECDVNPSTAKRTATVHVWNVRKDVEITVNQAGQIPYIHIEEETLEFSKYGETNALHVNSNVDWEIVTIPEWSEVLSVDEDKLLLKVEANKKEREGSLIVRTRDGGEMASVVIKQTKNKSTKKSIISTSYTNNTNSSSNQGAYIQFDKETIEFNLKGETKDLLVSTNSIWEIVEIPDWCVVERQELGKLVLTVEKSETERQGTLILKTKEGGAIASIVVTQRSQNIFKKR